MTSRRQAGVLYCAWLKYVSFTFVIAWLMWLRPLTQIWAIPSQPVLPYDALQASIRPDVGLQLTGSFALETLVNLTTLDALQSAIASSRYGSQVELTLSPTLRFSGFAVRAQW
jgi:hypothetical protein